MHRLRHAVHCGGAVVASAWSRYRRLPEMDLSPRSLDPDRSLIRLLLYCLMPAWLAAGLADWWWHKRTDIEHTAGTRESLLHIVMFAEVGIPLLLGLLARINAGALLAMWGAAVVHELTAFRDVAYAAKRREVAPREQHTHSFLEVLPFSACALASCLHWNQWRSLAGLGEKPDFRLRMKERKVPDRYWPFVAGMVLGVAAVYGNELYRCRRACRERPVNTAFPPGEVSRFLD
jgi:hypothetical protein